MKSDVDNRRSSADTEHSRRALTPATEIPAALTRRVVIENVMPSVDAGRFPIKRAVGESVAVTADIFADGHDVVVAVLRDREGQQEREGLDGQDGWRETPMALVAPGSAAWAGRFAVH